jgi:hypothetical protein
MGKKGIKTAFFYLLVTFLFFVRPQGLFTEDKGEDFFWRLGVGTYGTPPAGADEDTVLTHARFDWQMIAFGSQVDMPNINRSLSLNPEQRFLVRLWPRSGSDNFLDYLYRQDVRERIDKNISEQVHRVLNEISSPEQVVAFAFLEELPDRWHPFWRGRTDEQILAILKPYRAEIEKELGHPLVYDEKTKEWFWDRFAESMDKIHTAIRNEAGKNRLILFWCRFDWFSVDILKKIVHPGGADGVFIYVLKPGRWEEQVKIAEENHWPFFSQLSHCTGMKQAGWKECVDLPKIRSRYNLGYFFYGCGNPLRPHFFDNKAVDPVNNVRRFSGPVHLRWFAASQNLRWDVFKSNIAFKPLVDFRPTGKKAGDTVDLYAVIPNPLLEGHYSDKEDQKVTDVVVTLKLPDWLKVDDGSAVVEMGELGPSRHRAPSPESVVVGHWVLHITGKPEAGKPVEVAVKGTHTRLGTITGISTITGMEDHVLPSFQKKDVMVSGQGWAEPGFGIGSDIIPSVVMLTGGLPVINPSLTDGEFKVGVNLGTYRDNAGFYHLWPESPLTEGVNRIIYKDTLPAHSTLIIDSGGKATLVPTRPLLQKQFRSEKDPGTGTSSGYYLGAYGVSRQIPYGEKVVIEISGKKAGKVNSLLLVYFRCADTGEKKSFSTLVNRFGEEWRNNISVEIDPPFKNSIIESVALYRYPNGAEGTIWYGSLKVDLLSKQEEGKDVSSKIEGKMPLLRSGRYNVITYFDDDTKQPERNKLSIQFYTGTVPGPF